MFCTQYQDAGKRILEHGEWFDVERNGADCLTLWNVNLFYQTSNPEGRIHINTTRQAAFKLAVGELLGYVRGEIDAEAFKALKAPTWFNNAANPKWQANKYCEGPTHMGEVYGAIGNNWPVLDKTVNEKGETVYIQTGSIDLLEKIYNDLKNGIDDRGEIWTFWNPGMFHMGCLRPCMYSHHFTLLGGKLNLTSTQRSSDWPLGTVANMIQVQVLLRVMAQITGHEVGDCFHNNPNAHIYANQIEDFKKEMQREVIHELPILKINPNIKTLEDLRTWVTPDDFELVGYEHHELGLPKEQRINYEFTT